MHYLPRCPNSPLPIRWNIATKPNISNLPGNINADSDTPFTRSGKMAFG